MSISGLRNSLTFASTISFLLEPHSILTLNILLSLSGGLSSSLLVSLIAISILLLFSAMFSGSENAYFSLSNYEIDEFKSSLSASERLAALHLDNPRKLLATLLIANNFVNIGIVILSTIITEELMDPVFAKSFWGWFIQVVVVTFVILMLGEVIPKVYSTQKPKEVAGLMAYPLLIASKLFAPISFILLLTSNFIDKRIKVKGHSVSVGDLTHALDITKHETAANAEDQKILKGIVEFGNTDVKQIMKPRMDVKALDDAWSNEKVMAYILDAGYSRMPVYHDSIDNVIGILYIKDLLAFLNKSESLDWKSLIRPHFAVPESKKIDDLLKEFQHRKMHLALVVDEFGGLSGIVTLEDVMEEVVGDINDEFDDDEVFYSKLDDFNFVFEGKIALTNFYRILNLEPTPFEDRKGESDSLAGFILELEGKIPRKNQKINFNGLLFTIEAADNKRIKRVKVTLPKEDIS
ncbi:MAG: gliding motility-associated protein GldE [Bacteroidia bacterium]|nr:gliding motility-associated protein GldE [Bacteroidia bacterium]